jgi:hypothetical protein
MEITYRREGDYLIPNITLREKPPPDGYGEPLGRYARIRRAFLREHKPILYNQLLLSENLFPHLREIEEVATNRRKLGMDEFEIVCELVCE